MCAISKKKTTNNMKTFITDIQENSTQNERRKNN